MTADEGADGWGIYGMAALSLELLDDCIRTGAMQERSMERIVNWANATADPVSSVVALAGGAHAEWADLLVASLGREAAQAHVDAVRFALLEAGTQS